MFPALHVFHTLNSLISDVVRAYKGLLKEKEALEASIKALSIQQLEDDPDKSKEDSEGGEGERGGDEAAQEGEVKESGEKDSSLASCLLLRIRHRLKYYIRTMYMCTVYHIIMCMIYGFWN